MASGAVPKDKSVENQIWLEDIYNYLYTQKGNDPPPPIHIPSTVMLKYQRPCAWFSSRFVCLALQYASLERAAQG
jgi:hypothetical protein